MSMAPSISWNRWANPFLIGSYFQSESRHQGAITKGCPEQGNLNSKLVGGKVLLQWYFSKKKKKIKKKIVFLIPELYICVAKAKGQLVFARLQQKLQEL